MTPPPEVTRSIERMILSPHARQTDLDGKTNHLPEIEKEKFSFRRLWAFTGPGFMMSMKFMDLSIIELDVESAASAKYKLLLWVLLSSTVFGLFMHRLAARLGVVTGMHLAEMCYRQYYAVPRIILWLMTEVAIICYSIQEVIGTSIALHLLSNKGIPLRGGVIIALINTCMFMLLDIHGLRKLEYLFAFLISIMAVTFGYEYSVVDPEQCELLQGMNNPLCKNCDSPVLPTVVQIFGSVIMPHNLYLYSALVMSRDVDRHKPECIKEASRYFCIEACIALFISFIINVLVVGVFSKGLFNQTNKRVRDHCLARNITYYYDFPENDEMVTADIYSGGVLLGCYFGNIAKYIWAVGILASGLSSTMTGTYAGQFAMEGFLNLHWSGWKRVLLTRAITVVPTFFVAFCSQINDSRDLNDFLIIVMSMQLPLAIIPTIAFTSDGQIMDEFKNGVEHICISIMVSVLVIFLYLYYLFPCKRLELVKCDWFFVLELYGLLCLIMCAYLTFHMVVSIGGSKLINNKFISMVIDELVPTVFGIRNT